MAITLLRWSSIDLPGLQISMIWANAIIYMIWAGIQSSLKVIKAAPGCQKSFPSDQFNSLNFDSKQLSVRSVEDHLKSAQDQDLENDPAKYYKHKSY